MDFLKLRGCEHGILIALVFLDFIRHVEFFQKPEYAMRTGLVEMVDDDDHFRSVDKLAESFYSKLSECVVMK